MMMMMMILTRRLMDGISYIVAMIVSRVAVVPPGGLVGKYSCVRRDQWTYITTRKEEWYDMK